MGPRSSIIAGLLAGVAVAVVLVAGVLALAPGPATPSPSVVQPSLPPSPSASDPSGSPSLPPSASAPPSAEGGLPYHVGEPAPSLRVPQVGGGTIDLAGLRGHAVWVNTMPGVDVRP